MILKHTLGPSLFMYTIMWALSFPGYTQATFLFGCAGNQLLTTLASENILAIGDRLNHKTQDQVRSEYMESTYRIFRLIGNSGQK